MQDGYIAGQFLEEVAVGMDAVDVSELREILKSIKGPLQPRYDFSGKLFIPLWFEHALFSRIGHLTAHINTKELIAATSALVSAVLVIRGHHDAPIELYTDNSTCCKMLKHWKPTPLGDNVIDASQSLLQERLLNAVAVSVPDPVLENVTLYSPSGDLVPQLILPFSHDLKDLLRGLVWYVHECTAHACAGIVHTLIKSYCTWQGQKKFALAARDRIQHYCGVRELITIPWYRVGLDVFGPIYRAKAYERLGKPPFNYILTYTCLYSGKTVVRPLHTRSGREIAQVHREVTADFGVIPIISVDCGSEFLSKEFLSVTVEDGSRVVYDAPNSPWSRAPLERRHATISKLLRVLAATKKTELWHTHLYKATRALNQSSLLRDGRMLSPDMLFFAYKPPVSSPLWMISADQQARLVDLREQLRLRLVWDGEWMSNRESDRLLVDTRGKVPRDIPVVNDFVLVWSDLSGDKFRQAWRGPFRVIGFNAKGQVLLEGLKRPQAISNVKKYYQGMDAKNEATIEAAVASPKASSTGRDLQEADFFMMNNTLYQAVDVDKNRAVCLGHPASICDDVIFIDDSVEEFDLINDDIQRLSGIRIGPGNQVTLNRSARKLMSEHN
ncbi:hypothetical protein FOZ63_025761 [Perkinsus olseni]|uniref:Integrase catalytic domain-containing protein n=1 Tax=Perkinsus olseni TaxID=32597 RepID=A0A7J6RVX0_PEROL|nr:hypothetical protein FOZ60_014847 [Perkinsus olseni]KAF4724415.1 hypothetical protein FOZ63_025761 [Perkinsus olseni]